METTDSTELTEQLRTSEQVRERLNRELEAIMKVCQQYQEKQRIFHHSNSVSERVKTIIREYEDIAAESLRASKDFRDRMLVVFRSFSMVLEMVGNASTHREKDARLRGCIELVETSIGKLEKESFDIGMCERPRFDWAHLFRADFPHRHYLEKIRDLQAQVASLQPKQPEAPEPEKVIDPGF